VAIDDTTWAKDFKATCPSSYARALEYAAEPGLPVTIALRTDVALSQADDSSKEPQCWAVIVDEPRTDDDDFWLGGYPTREEAVALCQEMQWLFNPEPSERELQAVAQIQPLSPTGGLDLDGLAHEIWAAAQLLPDEGIEDGIERIKELLATIVGRGVCGSP
jgi:hypothetical protein